MGAGSPRNFTITGQCGVPSGTDAVSLNLTVTNTAGPGFILIYPAGGSQPTVSTVNYVASQTIANAAIVPLGTGGAVTVIAGVSGTDFIMDINGYFSDTLGTPANYFRLFNNSNGYTMRLDNASTSCGGACGLFATVASGVALEGSSDNSHGIYGFSNATTGNTHGVQGWSNQADTSNGSAVFGFTPYTFTKAFSTSGAGVRGEGRNGVVGVTSSGSPVGEGAVIGVVANSAGGLGPFGYLGNASLGDAIVGIGNSFVSGTKSFGDPHPTDPTKMIAYVSLEGPESGTYFRGTARTSGGVAIIDVPEDFRLVTDPEGLSVQLTPVGAAASLYVVSEDLNQIVVHSSRDVKFHYMVNGVRQAFKDYQPIKDSFGAFVPPEPGMGMSSAFSPEQRRRLIANGTFNEDGTVNMDTAARYGWARIWEDRARAQEAGMKAAAEGKANGK